MTTTKSDLPPPVPGPVEPAGADEAARPSMGGPSASGGGGGWFTRITVLVVVLV